MKGFTLIELMIVVVIIGILSAIAIPKFHDVSDIAKQSACRANMRTIASQESIFQASHLHNKYGTLAQIDMVQVRCPSAVGFVYTGITSDELTINCPSTPSHGNIIEGVPDWHDAY